MSDFLFFVSQQWMLVTALFALFALLALHESRKGGPTIGTSELVRLINDEDCQVLDLRSAKDFAAGHITGARNIPHQQFSSELGKLGLVTDRPLALVCAMGQHAGAIGRNLREAGFSRVYRLGGGILEWQRQQLPLVTK